MSVSVSKKQVKSTVVTVNGEDYQINNPGVVSGVEQIIRLLDNFPTKIDYEMGKQVDTLHGDRNDYYDEHDFYITCTHSIDKRIGCTIHISDDKDWYTGWEFNYTDGDSIGTCDGDAWSKKRPIAEFLYELTNYLNGGEFTDEAILRNKYYDCYSGKQKCYVCNKTKLHTIKTGPSSWNNNTYYMCFDCMGNAMEFLKNE